MENLENELLIDIRNWYETIRERHPNKDTITFKELVDDYYDLIDENNHKDEIIQDLRQDIEDNYRPVTKKEQWL